MNPTPQQIQQGYQQLEKEISVYINKIADLETEMREHDLVVAALSKADPKRRCFRLVGGVLAERTVVEVKPQVEENRTRVAGALKHLQDTLKQKSESRKKFIEKYNLNKPQANPAAVGDKEKEAQGLAQSTGVLV